MDPSQRPQIAQDVILSPALDPGFDLRALSRYTSLSVRLLRKYISLPVGALPHHRFGAKIVVYESDWRRWRAQFRRVGSTAEERIARRRRAQQGRAKLRRAPRPAA